MDHAPSLVAPMGRELTTHEWAERQHGVVGRGQLGWSEKRMRTALAAGRLHEVHRGVYAVGHRKLTMRGRWMAAVLATGGVLSHRSAAALHGIRRSSVIEVTGRRRRRAGIRVYESTLRPDEITTVDGIPCTTVARTLLDLAAVAPPHQVEGAINEAEYLRLADHPSLDDLVARYPRRPGTKALRRIRGTHLKGRVRSDLELDFIAFLDEHGLPRPLRNHVVLGLERDCVWPEHRLIVELDGGAAHGTSRRFHDHRARDRKTTLAGWTSLRVTREHLDADLAADLRRATSSPWRPSAWATTSCTTSAAVPASRCC